MILIHGVKAIAEGKDVKKYRSFWENRKYSTKIIETRKIDRPILSDSSDDPVFNTIENLSKQTSVLKIKQARNQFGQMVEFSFTN